MNLLNKKTDMCDNISIQGYSHIKIDKECQDNSISWQGNDYCGIIVCDGHGGDKYIRSAVGSKLACQVGKKNISAFMEKFEPKNEKQIDGALEQLEKAIVSAWYMAIDEDISASPIKLDDRFNSLSDSDKNALISNPIKAYGSTFIAAVKKEDYCFVLKLGDGNTVFVYADGTTELPQELSDDDCQFNVTTSLCNNDALLSFMHSFRKIDDTQNISGIILTSDGVINCYKSEKQYTSFMQNVYFGYGEDGIEKAREELIPVLGKLSEHGSGDDLSVAIIRVPFSENEQKLIAKKIEDEEKERLIRETEKAKLAEEKERLAREKAEKDAEEERIKMEEDAKKQIEIYKAKIEELEKQKEDSEIEKERLKKELLNKENQDKERNANKSLFDSNYIVIKNAPDFSEFTPIETVNKVINKTFDFLLSDDEDDKK